MENHQGSHMERSANGHRDGRRFTVTDEGDGLRFTLETHLLWQQVGAGQEMTRTRWRRNFRFLHSPRRVSRLAFHRWSALGVTYVGAGQEMTRTRWRRNFRFLHSPRRVSRLVFHRWSALGVTLCRRPGVCDAHKKS
ncbi:unnamed protein product [Ranitomeya imitator]|uniref:Uncharacterized protein n=1 Tax=Ranitomeya imitator TaxID=111125 RepID=A0ABN9L7D1_9NEOB|nr:unnamed protein product [Ranitomeya imitator]